MGKLLYPRHCMTCGQMFDRKGAYIDYGDGIVECRAKAACEQRAGKPQTHDGAVPIWSDEPARRFAIELDGLPKSMQCGQTPRVGGYLYVTTNRNTEAWTKVRVTREQKTGLPKPFNRIFSVERVP